MSYLFETLSPNFARNQRAMLERDSMDLEQPEPGLFTGLDRADTYGNAIQTIGAEAKTVAGLALSQWPKALDNATAAKSFKICGWAPWSIRLLASVKPCGWIHEPMA